MSDERTSVLIVDDSSLMRAALSQMIDQQADMEVAGTAATGHEAVRKAVERQVRSSWPRRRSEWTSSRRLWRQAPRGMC